ncbi:hypothetical protein ACQ4PT_033197 [Festuca glaucescens]
MAALHTVFDGNDKFFGGLNYAFLTLVPKGDAAAVEMKDFRPISLVHSFAKLVAKILAARLAPKMQELVDPSQSTFIKGVLADLRAVGIKHRVSLYVDDLVVFARPVANDLRAVHAILRCFGGASSLHVNLAKSVAAPIRCSDATTADIAPTLACPLMQFPCVYLGLPLTIGRPRKGDLQLVLDKLAAKLPHWKARLLTKEGRVAFVHVIMTASVVYQLLALDLDPWFLEAVDKLRRDFFWAGDRDSSAGHCMVAWNLVC